MASELTYVVRIILDRAARPLGASVTGYEDDRETYRVDPLVGPFDTLSDVLEACGAALDRQGTLW